jgi:outer membrane protein OmpA-like peptidoglycan-associated protein
MKLRTGLIAAAILCSASATALGQQTNGLYLGLGAGANFARDAEVNGTGIDTEAGFDTGWAGIGSVGYGFGNGLRLELELGYRENDVDGLSGQTSSSGSTNVMSGMLNLLYDIPTGTGFTPYLGIGGGYARVEADGIAPVAAGNVSVDDSDNVFAYQGILGVAYGITQNLKLGLDYRYFATQDPEFSASNGSTVDSEYAAHTVLLALRWEFGAPARPQPAVMVAPPAPAPAPAPQAAPPPPAPAPAIQRSFLVFFDFDRSNITTEADRVIREAAANAKRGSVSRINVTGHADRAGPDAYNMALSMRRADAVKAVLVREGVPANQIAVVARGEAQPLVPTADGVREPQNRRVEIVLQ